MTQTPERISELAQLFPLPAGADVPVAYQGRNYRVPGSAFAPDRAVFSVLSYTANPSGVAGGTVDPSAAFLAADAAAAAVGGTVYVPKGTYGTGANWTLALSSGVTLEGDGDVSVLVNCYLTCTGTAGAEIPFTAPAAKGATSISIPATALTGAWLRLSSCINMQSDDAGVDRLGHDPTAMGFFSEYVQVLAGSAGSATLSGALTWAYSNTPGGDSGSFTASVARVMSFHEGGRIRRLKLFGKNSAHNQNIEATFAKGLVIEDVTIDCNDITSQLIRLTYCLDCRVVRGTMIGKRTSVPAGSTANPIVFLSSQHCSVDGASIYYGNQGIDFDAYPNDATYRGAPCVECFAVNCKAFDQASDNYTSHWGNYGSFFANNTGRGAPRGIRLRDRGSRAQGNILINGAGTGIGIYLDNAAAIDGMAVDNTLDGYLFGIQWGHSAAGYETLEGLLGLGQGEIARNRIRNSLDYGIYCSQAYTAAVMVGPRIVDNEISFSMNHSIFIDQYCNGAIVDRNRVYGVPTTKAGIRFGENIKRLYIGTNHIFGVNATGFCIQGSGVAAFLTDATTFPAGNAEALLFVAPQVTDAASGFVFQSVIRDTTAYLAPRVNGYGPFAAAFGTSGPTVERQTMGFYLSGSSLRADTRDTSNAFVTHQMNIRGAGTPEGAVTAGIGSTYQRTDGGAGTSFYVKESGSGNTGWVAK